METTGYTILSAKHDILWPHIEVEPYDTTVEELAEQPAPVEPDDYQETRYPWNEPEYHTRLDFWTRRVHFGRASWLGFKSGFPEEDPHCRRLIVLAGDRYVDPLLENDVFEPFPWDTEFPFKSDELGGIGDQMRWLNEEADRYEEYERSRIDAGEQADLYEWTPPPEPVLERPDVDGQSDWNDWL